MHSKEQVRAQIRECQACSLHERCRTPIPYNGVGELAIITEGPRDRATEDFMVAAMREAGILEPVVWLSVVACPPWDKPGAVRIPQAEEINACSTNFQAQLAAAAPRFAILAGGVALRAVRPDLRTGKAHGKPFYSGDILMLPVYHPSAVQRNKAWRDDLIADLSLMQELIEDVRADA